MLLQKNLNPKAPKGHRLPLTMAVVASAACLEEVAEAAGEAVEEAVDLVDLEVLAVVSWA